MIRFSKWLDNIMNDAYTTHFMTQIFSTAVDNEIRETSIPELVRKKSSLISLIPSKTDSVVILAAGKNCSLSDNQATAIAEVSGYPILSQATIEEGTIVSVEIIPIINISDDKMLATLTLYPSISGTPTLELKDILVLCKEQEINFGIDELTIQETIGMVAKFQQPQHEILIARGLLPVDGCDAFLRFEVEIGPLPGKILQDGTIDWRERKIFIGIDKGELIATKIPYTLGTAGVDLHGLAIPQKPGKDIFVKVTGDVEYIEESRQVLATESGVLSVVNETDVKVSTKQTIDGDVDFSVGNIVSNDGLEIKGDIKSGFTVNCKGDLSIEGNIHDATVTTKGNSKIASGLIGEYAELITDGDVEISFVERGKITSGGTVIITKAAYYANISSKKMLLCRPDSKIVGGSFCSGLNFIGSKIGSDNAVPTMIAVGVNVERFQQRDKLKITIGDLENELENLIQMHGQEYTEKEVYKNKEKILQKYINNFNNLNLIPDSPIYSRHDPAYSYCPAFIAIQGQISSGTKVRIGNTHTTLEENATGVRFYIDKLTGHIVATPYSEGKK